MPAKATTTEKALHVRLLEGFEVKARPDGTVHTIRAGGKVVAECCVGTKKVRLNLRDIPAKGKTPKSIELSGRSKSWPGGGVNVDEGNLTAARALLAAITAVKPEPVPTAAAAARVSAAATSEAQTARKAVARAGRRSGVKVTA